MSSSTKVFKSEQVEYLAEATVCDTPTEICACQSSPEIPASEIDAMANPDINSEQELAILELANGEAAKIVSAAQTQAASIIAQAEQAAQELQRQAAESGRTEGFAAGQKEAETTAAAIIGEAKQLLAAAEAKSTELMLTAENELVEAAIKIAARVIEKEVSLDPNLILRTVRKALQGINQRDNLILKVCPQDVELLVATDLLELGISDVRIIADAQLLPGECIVDGGHGRLDATFDTQLATIKRKLEVVNGV
ncbi:MAG: FliH/SctL family protein [Peptococcaceae bacterium]|nr:FliH/SctL family protein [Peptococcaceae bacterium]